MHQNNFTEITTERLVLRKLKETDWEMISYLRSDKEVNKFVKRPNAPSKEKALEFISKTNNAIDNNSILYWVITEKGKNEMIGSICLWNFSEDKKKAEIGYDLSPEFQRKGIMDESLKNVLKFGFNTLLLDAIVAYTQYNNKSSVKLLKRNNFKLVEDLKDEENEYNRIFEIKKEA